MSLPFIFANLSGNVPAADLDTNFNAVAAMGVTQCTATGTNTIALAQNANQPPMIAYSNYQLYSFVAANSTTGLATVNVNSIGALPLYLPDGVTQVNTGDIPAGAFNIIGYNAALNGNLGGFQLLSRSTSSTSSPSSDNRIINGDFVLDQRNEGAAVTPTASAYVCDRWKAAITQASKLTFQRLNTALNNFA